ncbi:MAG TPA: DNA polymerase III subunit delta' [Gammaproteobacteria bacterium]|nr:DNA polymerase III subunit delta' [Gammaproteobacteria bacterium]
MALNTLPGTVFIPLPWQLPAWQQLHVRLENGTLPHALLISGVSGTGKQHFAYAFAALALCRQPKDGYACGQCGACRQFAAAAHPDFHRVTIPEDKSGILVDQIRELSQKLALTSQHNGWKIAAVTPADAMNVNAANSLLKTLEEPSAGTLLLLVTARPARLPATISSRCQAVRISTPSTDMAVAWLNQHESRSDWRALLKIAGGGPMLAQDLANNELMRERLQFYAMLMELRNGQRNPIVCAAETGKDNMTHVLKLMQAWVADLITLSTTGNPHEPGIINADALVMLQNTRMGINLRALHAFLSRINEAMVLTTTPVNGQLLLENLFMDWSEGLRTLETIPLAARGG